jgi:thiol-disulfide isomerase/thioredoxin
MVFRLIWFFTGLLSFGAGCQSHPVSGSIDFSGTDLRQTVYLLEAKSFSSLVSSFECQIADSASVDKDGHFSFPKMPVANGQNMYILAVQKKGEKFLNRLENDDPLHSNYLVFLYEPGHTVIIKSKASSMLAECNLSGTIVENKVIQDLSRKRAVGFQSYLNIKNDAREENLLDAESAKLNFQHSLFNIVKENDNVFLQALALRWCSPAGDYERISEYVSATCSFLKNKNRNHHWVNQICATAQTLPPVTGQVFPDVALPMMAGDTISVHTLLSSKLTLIDLWASWCAPCRKENKEILVPLWDTFHTQGFSIVGYALDSSEKGWKNAIQKDGAYRWQHASHLTGDESPVFDSLKMTTIPANFLLNEKGVILAKNLHGQALRNFVEEYMK